MIGKSVRVYWPVDSSWYTGKVQGFNPDTGEHLLKYPDNDEEWVRIGDMRQAQLPPSMGGPGGGASDNDLQGAGGMVPKPQPMMSPMQSPPPAPDTAPSNPNNNSGGVTPGGGGAPLSPKWLGPDATGMPPIYFPYQGAPPPPPPHHGGMPMSAGHGGMYMGYGGAGGPPPVPYHHPMVYHHSMPNMGLDNDAASANDPSGRNKKQGPKPWSKEEDTCLSGLVRTMQWPMVAQSLAGRTGKQCRERYVNHLNPRLKTSEWSPVEDATIFHLYNTLGSHWAKMSKIIPGRTDNGQVYFCIVRA
jgi:hypothetical protein